jgi:CHAT domain-containing protein/Tfp pilus assembly protein PilF
MHSRFRLVALAALAGALVSGAAAGAPQAAPDELLAKARGTYETEGPATALPLFEQALAGYRAAGDRRGEAITLGLVGNCHKRLGDLDRALEELRQALAIKRELGDRLEEGKTLSHLGLVLWERGEYPEALRHLDEAAAIGRRLSEARLEGSALNNLALVYDELGDYTRSLAEYRRALELYRRTDFPRGEGDTLGNIGGVHQMLGRYREAIGYYRQALAISTRLGSTPAMSQDLGNIALCHAGLGEAAEAISDYDRALELARAAGLAKEEADWLKGKGMVLVTAGRHGEGLELMRRALARYEASGLQRERAEALEQIASLDIELGDLAAAEVKLRQSVDVARAIGNARCVLNGLVALGEIERHRRRPEQAAALFREALEGARSAGDHGLESACRTRLSFALAASGQLAPAREEASCSVDLAVGESARLLAAEARFALGEAERRLGKASAALEQYGAGERLVDALGEPDVAWRLAHGRGRALEALGRDADAVEAYRRAVALIETVRARLREERSRAGYIEERYEVYVDLVRLLLRTGRDEEAFGTAERLRARSYLDLLSADRDPGMSPAQQARAAELRQRIRTLERALDAEVRDHGSERRQAAVLFSSELAAAEAEYETFLASLRGTDPALAAAWSLAIPPVESIRAALPADAALVDFVVGEDETMIFVLTRERLHTRVARVCRRDLTAKVALLRDLVLRRGEDWRVPAASLADHLVEPLESADWLAGRRLYIVPHGILHHLPFALLPMGPERRALVAEHELTVLPAAGALVLPTATRQPRGAVLAVAPSGARLRHAGAEARAVAESFAEPRLLLLGEAATESAFKDAAAGFRVIHLATHSRWNRLNPLFSGLELEPSGGDDGHLEVHEILGLRLQASLVALSACETALGSDLLGSVPSGDDFIGLTRAFLHAGSGAVLASLWEVEDRPTLELMRAFYGRLAAAGSAAALAAAQRALLASGDAALSHPAGWAAFVLVGQAPAVPLVTTGTNMSVKVQ